MQLAPNLLWTIETQIKTLQSTNWDRVIQYLMWDRIMKTRESSTKRDILNWLLDSVRLYPEGDGGNKRYDDMAGVAYAIENSDVGAGLRLTRNEIEFNQLKLASGSTVSAYDFAGNWARQIGAASAYYPQQQLFKLLLNGTTQPSYDGVPFFSASHPIYPLTTGGPTYSNIITNVPLRVTTGASEMDNVLLGRFNYGQAVAKIRAQRAVNGVPRFLVPSVILVQSADFDLANMVIQAGVISATTNTGPQPNRPLEIIACPELDDLPAGQYVIGVDNILSDEMGAFMWSAPRPFETRFYGWMDESQLSRMKEFQWDHDGTNTAAYGHPFLAYLCKPGA